MELVYLWVEGYKNIKRQGFNFSSRFTCDYDEDENKLTIDENDDYIENFFGDNINVTAIVGKNGSGKSNILERLASFNWYEINHQMIVITYENDSFTINIYNFCSKEFEINARAYSDGCVDEDIEKTYEKNIINHSTVKKINVKHTTKRDSGGLYRNINFEGYIKTSIIYYTASHFDRCFKIQDIADLHYIGLLNKQGEYNQYIHHSEFVEGIIYLYKNVNADIIKLLKQILKIDIPDSILLIPNYNVDVLFRDKESIGRLFDFEEDEIQKIVESINSKLQESRVEEKINEFIYLLYFSDILQSMTTNSLSTEDYQKHIKKFKETWESEKNIIDSIKSFIRGSNILIDQDTYSTDLNYIHQLVSYFEENAQFDLTDNPDSVGMEMHINFILKFSNINKEFINLLKNKKFTKLFNYNFIGNKQVVKFSSGQIAFINLFIALHQMSQSSLKENIIFCFDEIELFLHPEWQRNTVHILYAIIKELFPKEKKKQVIITTHSPFVVSDLPKNNLIFLNNKKLYKQTFGANIHTLLSDSFFMEDGLMGEFAKGKINEVIQYLNGDKNTKIKNDNEAQKFINIIGEPIIKSQLQRKLDSKRLSKVDKIDVIERKIKELQKELKKVQK